MLDDTCNGTLPTLISGLESILFAINIDAPSLNIPSKLNKSQTVITPSELEANNLETNPTGSLPKSFQAPYPKTNAVVNKGTKVVKLKKPIHNKRKNNVIVFDEETVIEETSSSETSPKSLIVNDINKSASHSDLVAFNKKERPKLDIYDSKSLNENIDGNLIDNMEHGKDLESPKITLNGANSPDTSCDSANDKNFDIYS